MHRCGLGCGSQLFSFRLRLGGIAAQGLGGLGAQGSIRSSRGRNARASLAGLRLHCGGSGGFGFLLGGFGGFGFGSGFGAHFLGGFHRSLALHLVGALFVVFGLTRSERFLLLDFLLVLFVDLLHRVFDGVVSQGVVDFSLYDLVHFILGAAELRNRLANGFRDGGQFVGTENQKAEQENEEELSSTDTKHGTTFPFVHTTVPYYHTHGQG